LPQALMSTADEYGSVMSNRCGQPFVEGPSVLKKLLASLQRPSIRH